MLHVIVDGVCTTNLILIVQTYQLDRLLFKFQKEGKETDRQIEKRREKSENEYVCVCVCVSVCARARVDVYVTPGGVFV